MYWSVANNVTALMLNVKNSLYPLGFLLISVYTLNIRCTASNINIFIVFSFLSHPPNVIPYEITLVFTNVNGFSFQEKLILYLVFEMCNFTQVQLNKLECCGKVFIYLFQ